MPAITPAPPLACDAHMHVYDARYPHSGTLVNSALPLMVIAVSFRHALALHARWS
ncbi:MAG: hypothetical protein CBARDMAM_3640 [uncultured Caballeronia sp.]|nr:MAG: hypothetical protein CBARDMAM_3640 [uncultured Caballeronia sp.]